jgi:hypothetical protein
VVDPGTGEECEPGGVGGHDDWSCDRATCKLTSLHGGTLAETCRDNSECSSGEVCDQTLWFGFPICLPVCRLGSCTLPTGWSALPCGGADNTTGCFVKCKADGTCPSGSTCKTITTGATSFCDR